jgi:hypothetical protein
MFLGSACRKELKGGYDGIQKWHTVIVMALVYNNKTICDADLILTTPEKQFIAIMSL